MTVSELACGSRQLSFRSAKKAMGSHRFCTKVDFCTHEKIASQQGAQYYPLSYKKKGVNFHIFARLPMFQYEILQKLPI